MQFLNLLSFRNIDKKHKHSNNENKIIRINYKLPKIILSTTNNILSHLPENLSILPNHLNPPQPPYPLLTRLPFRPQPQIPRLDSNSPRGASGSHLSPPLIKILARRGDCALRPYLKEDL